jgi:hypothetical protein
MRIARCVPKGAKKAGNIRANNLKYMREVRAVKKIVTMVVEGRCPVCTIILRRAPGHDCERPMLVPHETGDSNYDPDILG